MNNDNDDAQEPITRQQVVDLLAANREDMLSRESAQQIIGNRLHRHRPISWENDISLNALDETPFEVAPSPAEIALQTFNAAIKENSSCSPETLGDRDVMELIAKDTLPIPIPQDRENYFPGYDEKYWLFGLSDYLRVMQVAEQFDLEPKSVLDFGCSSGRVIRHFACQSNIPEIWGTDINRRHIRWLYEHMPMHVKPVFNHCIPTLPIPESSVDVITAFSVFTHIDTFEIHWIAELSRILSRDGFCYLTIHNEDTWQALGDQIENKENRLVQSMIEIDPNVADQLRGPLPGNRLVYRFSPNGPYRAQVFLSNQHIEQVWGRFFKIENILPQHHQRQTVVVLKKR
jgi:ubiquinone/menaquinone biosynthesis C-methylase UbiE